MKRSVISIVLLAGLAVMAAMLCTGCDLVRASLGKPTSADLELLRIAERVRAETALKDSLAAVSVAAPAEDPAPADTVAAEEVKTDPAPAPTPAPKPAAADGIKKYYVVVGAFKEEAGLQNYTREVEKKGFKTVQLPFKSGSTAICLEGTDDIETARTQMKELRASGIDSWLYSSNQKLHKEQ